MKYVLLALAILFSATVSAKIYTCDTVEECNRIEQQDRKRAEEISKLPFKEQRRLEIESLGPVEEQHAYYGSGVELSDKDIYIDGKKYHCIEYEMNTQCHID